MKKMVKIEELRAENQEIVELCEVLTALIDHSHLRNNPVFCELIARFSNKVKAHLSREDQAMYSEMLTHSEKKLRDTASLFMGNTRELKKLFAGYAKQWCHPSPDAHEHAAFVKETQDMFRIIKERIRMENEQLFPVLAQI
jgi:hemerythrin-like domain-containing protein